MTCIFCDIIAGDVPAYTVYETENVIAFLDINPITSGHTLVVPRKHIPRLNLMTDFDIAAELMDALIHLSSLMIERGICEDFSILQANGQYADQGIPHLHCHLIPRYRGDGVALNLPTDPEAARKDNMEKIWMLFNAGEIGEDEL